MEKTQAHFTFPEQNQNFWQLASIQSASLGIPGIFIGDQLASHYGTTSAILSIFLGNLILWIVGLGVISMGASERNNALENVRNYLGKTGGVFATLFLILSFISWYILQLNSANAVIAKLFLYSENQLRLGASAGVFIALLSIGGIKFIRKYCVFIFPLLLIFIFYSMANSIRHFKLAAFSGLSLPGIIIAISTTLPGMVNLPTFFRHSRSRADSYLGLTLMILFTMLFQIYAVIVGLHDETIFSSNSFIYSIIFSLFIILSLVSVNLVNIYFASAGWEMIFPHRKSSKEFVIIGLLGTLAYTFFQVSKPMHFLLSMAENFIASLGIVLLLSFLVKIFSQHRPRIFEKGVNFSCWFIGAILGTIFSSKNGINTANALIISFCATSLAFLFIMYLEETFWSVKTLIQTKK